MTLSFTPRSGWGGRGLLGCVLSYFLSQICTNVIIDAISYLFDELSLSNNLHLLHYNSSGNQVLVYVHPELSYAIIFVHKWA